MDALLQLVRELIGIGLSEEPEELWHDGNVRSVSKPASALPEFQAGPVDQWEGPVFVLVNTGSEKGLRFSRELDQLTLF